MEERRLPDGPVIKILQSLSSTLQLRSHSVGGQRQKLKHSGAHMPANKQVGGWCTARQGPIGGIVTKTRYSQNK